MTKGKQIYSRASTEIYKEEDKPARALASQGASEEATISKDYFVFQEIRGPSPDYVPYFLPEVLVTHEQSDPA